MSHNIEQTVLAVINRHSNVSRPADLDTPLPSLGITSVKIMQVINQIEIALDFELEEEHLSMAHFASGRHMVRLLKDHYFSEVAS